MTIPLTVGDLRRAIEHLPDAAPVFGNHPGCGADLAVLSWAERTIQIPWENNDWKKGDPEVWGLEIHFEDLDDEARAALRQP
jgi:hypothetical protein